MTKKSDARLMRDAKEKEAKIMAKQQGEALNNNNCWDELNDLSAQCTLLLAQYATVGEVLKNKALLNCVSDVVGLTQRLRIMKSDILTMNDELIKIVSNHRERNGGPSGESMDAKALDLMNCAEIYQLYMLWTERHDGVIKPVYSEILAIVNDAENRLKRIADVVLVPEEQVAAADAAETTPA